MTHQTCFVLVSYIARTVQVHLEYIFVLPDSVLKACNCACLRLCKHALFLVHCKTCVCCNFVKKRRIGVDDDKACEFSLPVDRKNNFRRGSRHLYLFTDEIFESDKYV